MNALRPATLCALAMLLALWCTDVARASAHVYLLRGIFNVSVGLDVLADKLARQRIAATVYGHDEVSEVATLAAQQYRGGTARPIILIGHSLGAGAALEIARQLDNSGIPVALLVLLDPVSSQPVPPNVGRAVNLFVSGGLGTQVGTAPGYRGSLNNLDFKSAGMDHMSIQAADSVHRQIIAYVRAVAGGEARTASPSAASPSAASPSAAPPNAASQTDPVQSDASQTAEPAVAHRGGRAKPTRHRG